MFLDVLEFPVSPKASELKSKLFYHIIVMTHFWKWPSWIINMMLILGKQLSNAIRAYYNRKWSFRNQWNIIQLCWIRPSRPQPFFIGVRSRLPECFFKAVLVSSSELYIFSKLCLCPLLSYIGDCEVLNAQTCNDPRQGVGILRE